ncbi:hypothetical protein CDAR_496651 [Caerostris darwini]|uniref:Uncharacterized protein n=1 Tax=Caerostris darwini TaxID=1538125 RepID=A0AAV4MUG4_9ARAC|nr:hypothetical protein CDAR_496651 [Caerostris darwini]
MENRPFIWRKKDANSQYRGSSVELFVWDKNNTLNGKQRTQTLYMEEVGWNLNLKLRKWKTEDANPSYEGNRMQTLPVEEVGFKLSIWRKCCGIFRMG